MTDTAAVRAFWEDRIVGPLSDYVRIPALSPAFDPQWEHNGHIDAAVGLACAWVAAQGFRPEVLRLPGRTPVLWIETPAGARDGVLLYGHLDKQPEMTGWRADLGPWLPVREGDRLYGRGVADDGYAVFAAVAALRLLAERGRDVPAGVLIECCEESGSEDLPSYLELLAPRLGAPRLVVCLDSGCGDYERLWCTTSLRGIASGDLRVGVLTEGVHSGDASGIVPSSFRIARQLLSRLEDEASGAIRLPAACVEVPPDRAAQARDSAAILAAGVYDKFAWAGSTRPYVEDALALVLNRTWRPYLEVTGAGGLPALAHAGNVLRPETVLRLSLRLPPTADAAVASAALQALLERDPPHGAKVSFTPLAASPGWNAPRQAAWLDAALDGAARAHFGAAPCYMGEGGTIPFMHLLGQRFPAAQFLITGVLGPQANAHGPNEFLHLPTAVRVTACVADVLAALPD